MHVVLGKQMMPMIFSVVFVFAIVAVFGFWHAYTMEMSADGQMQDCPFMIMGTICKMSIFDHVMIWRAMLVALPQEISFFSLSAFFSFFLAIIFLRRTPLRPLSCADEMKMLFLRESENPLFFYGLEQAFFRGIVHPKIYHVVL